jgi:MFS family permease
MSERFPTDRGAIMGLYSVFLAVGQIVGSLIGGYAAEWHGMDGLLVATIALLLIALLPVGQLRRQEYLLDEEYPELAPGSATRETPPAAPA